MEKTNMDYLKEYLKHDPLGMEWVEAVEKDHKEAIEDLEEKNKVLIEEKSELQDDKDNLQEELDDFPELKEIDFGYGKLEYHTDNMKLQQMMETLETRVTGI